ncbi:MAG: hypothetical protein LLG09_07500 [Negativicutes bacterium]|nr:hypothetical protein [Negativicutes bacterium]
MKLSFSAAAPHERQLRRMTVGDSLPNAGDRLPVRINLRRKYFLMGQEE